MHRHSGIGAGFRIGLAAAITVGALFPLYFLITASFKTAGEFSGNYFLPPFAPTIANLEAVFPTVVPSAWNSVQVVFWTALLMVAVVFPAAYAFSWHRFPGSKWIFTLLIATMMIPSVLTFVPQFILARQLGLIDSQPGIVLPFVAFNLGLSLYLMRSFLGAIPSEVIEAARVDGASEWQILFRIVLPLASASLLTIAVLTVVVAWNSFLWPLVAAPSEENRVASVAATFFALAPSTGSSFPLLMSAYLLSSIPLIIIMSALLRYFVRGVTEGAVKG